MNKTNIKNFAVWAREKLIMDIKDRARLLGITDKGIAEALPQSTADLKFFDIGTREYAEVAGKEIRQREALVKAIRDKEQDSNKYKEAFDFIVEEVAYTWFNRLVAIRFMEVNNYLPSGIRVLSSENPNKLEPDFITSPFDTDMDFTPYEQDKIVQYKDDNKLDELFKMLFIKQCNKLNEILPELFEKTDDYSELLLSISFKDSDGIVYHLVHDINEDDFNVAKSGQVEIIGWLYQYYISERHEFVIDPIRGKTICKEDIPAATQLFTTDWVVRYMVDNSLGRYWIERNPQSNLVDKLEYFVKPKDGHINYVDEPVTPKDITFFDPCMGSGHILVYAFDVLMDIYREQGYTERDAAICIVEHNLFGLDIDKRAYQLAYFAVMMKARYFNRRIFRNCIKNNLTYIEESDSIDEFNYEGLVVDKKNNLTGDYLVKTFRNAREYGSLINVDDRDYEAFSAYLKNIEEQINQYDIFNVEWVNNKLPILKHLCWQAEIMSKRYTVVCTNPPYMNKYEDSLKNFLKKYYDPYKGDLFCSFMYKNFSYCIDNGYSAFMTPNVWMFIKTYQSIREYIVDNKNITTLVQMAKGAFFKEATVDICSFVLRNSKNRNKGYYIRLEDFKGDMSYQGTVCLEAIKSQKCSYFYEVDQSDFYKIEGLPIAYWASDKARSAFTQANVFPGITKKGVLTGNNDRFLRFWFEVPADKIGFDMCSHDQMVESSYKWFPVTSGGYMRKWYGNYDTVVNLERDGYEIKNSVKNYRLREAQYYFREAITWTEVSSGIFSVRYVPVGILFGNGGPVSFFDNDLMLYCLGLLNSKIVMSLMEYLAPTVNYGPEQIKKIPVLIQDKQEVETLVKEAISKSKRDWDFFETSWNFRCDPLLCNVKKYKQIYPQSESLTMEETYRQFKKECKDNFEVVKNLEENLNRIFIDIYGLQEELDIDVEDKDVSVCKIYDEKKDIPSNMRNNRYVLTRTEIVKNFISYAVGCMFGRYSLEHEGLVFASGKLNISFYQRDIYDKDNCIPITDEDYFEDDIVGRFVNFVEVVFGSAYLEENLTFIANSLGNKGKTSRDVIRNYFLNDFIKDHIKKYQKRPIYWLFDSGKQNGFKALVYMHRWNADTVGNMRVEYLHKMQLIYEREIPRMQDMIDSSKDSREIATAEKRKEKLQKQYKEIKDYDAKVAHIALSRIDIDLDDGVKVNYEKVQTAQDGKHLQILTKI